MDPSANLMERSEGERVNPHLAANTGSMNSLEAPLSNRIVAGWVPKYPRNRNNPFGKRRTPCSSKGGSDEDDGAPREAPLAAADGREDVGAVAATAASSADGDEGRDDDDDDVVV